MGQQNIGYMIKVLSETIGQRVNRSSREFNLTMQQMKILRFLKEREGKDLTTQKDIQEHMQISHPTVVHIIRLMEEKGFVTTATSQTDKRMKMVSLTGQEESFVKKMIEGIEETERQLLKGLTQEEQNDLRRYLQRLYENITQGDEKGPAASRTVDRSHKKGGV